jgi:protein Cut8
MSSRKRKNDDDDEMSVSPLNSPSISSRQLARPSKKIRATEVTGRPLSLPRLLETLDATQLRGVLRAICERRPEIGHDVVNEAPRPSVASALQVLDEYYRKLQDAFPYGAGQSSSDYNYYRVQKPLVALTEAISDFTPQYLPPTETQTMTSLQYLDGATKMVHQLPEWNSATYRQHKESAYDEISRAWALVITEASKRGGGFLLHNGRWDQILAKHNEVSGGRLGAAISAMATNVDWIGNTPNSAQGGNSGASILDQITSGRYGSPVRVGPW